MNERQPLLEANFLELLGQFTAGDPMREGVLWTNLSVREISRRLAEMGTPASRGVVRQLLRKHRLGQRRARKKKALGTHPDRDAQFLKIASIKSEYLQASDPVISIDTKKKELIGNFSREGRTHTQTQVETLDHDFPSAGNGKLIPHGIYDLARNEGYMHLNTSSDTSEFCCDSIAHWWQQHGRQQYPQAKRLLLLCDGGGSNASNRHVFKEALQALSDRLGLEIRGRTTRRIAPSTTPSSTVYSRTSPGHAKASSSTPWRSPSSSWSKPKPQRA